MSAEQTQENNWYVITGPPSSGTSTTANILREAGFNAVEEAARLYVDEGVRRGLTVEDMRADERSFQENIASLKSIVEATQRPEVLTFFVRGMPDTTAYMRLQDLPMANWLKELVEASRYREVFLLDPLPVYDRKDYARIEDEATALRIGELLFEAYTEVGMEPITVPAAAQAERAAFITDYITGKYGTI